MKVKKKKMQFLVLVSSTSKTAYAAELCSHDSENPRRLQHGTRAVDIERREASGDGPSECAGAVLISSGPVGAVGIGDVAQSDDGADEGTDEEEVDKGDEACRVFGTAVEEQRPDGPRDRQCRYYEEYQDIGRSAQELAVVPVHEPSLVQSQCRTERSDSVVLLPTCPWSG